MLNTLKEFIYMRSKLIIINGLNYIINFILDNLKDFFIYLKNSNILNIGFGMVLGTQITLFVSAVLDYIFKPIIDRFIILFNKTCILLNNKN